MTGIRRYPASRLRDSSGTAVAETMQTRSGEVEVDRVRLSPSYLVRALAVVFAVATIYRLASGDFAVGDLSAWNLAACAAIFVPWAVFAWMTVIVFEDTVEVVVSMRSFELYRQVLGRPVTFEIPRRTHFPGIPSFRLSDGDRVVAVSMATWHEPRRIGRDLREHLPRSHA